MPLVDHEIHRGVREYTMIHPFDEKGLSSMGYDLTLGSSFLLPVLDVDHQIVDPFNPPSFQRKEAGDYIIIPAHSFVLGTSVEILRLPSSIMGICVGRSTYARAGIITHVTPVEPGWNGRITIEISNTNLLPVKVHVGVGITQVIFLRSDVDPLLDYAAKGGRYQGQTTVTQGRPEPVHTGEVSDSRVRQAAREALNVARKPTEQSDRS